jgi:hypothetical protein
MPNSTDWNQIGQQALAILTEEFGPLLQAGSAEAQEKLATIAKELATYWALAQAGDPTAAENLKWLKAEMRLVIARYAIASSAAAKRAALKAFDLIAQIGARLLMALIVAA